MFAYVEDIQKLNIEQLNTMVSAQASLAKDIDVLTEESKDFSKRSIENAQAFVRKLSGVRKVNEAIELHSDYVQTAQRDLLDQAFKVGNLYFNFASKVLKSAESGASSAKKPTPVLAKARVEQ
jgi:hypothetical protein